MSDPLPTTLGEALALAQGRIPPSEARILLREASGESATGLIAFPERELSATAAVSYANWLERRATGEPVAYLLGWREFFGRRFAVTPATLIPRPDTELIVECALGLLRDQAQPRVLDLGTGSGAIAVTLALECAQAEVWAVDQSADALAVAMRNAEQLGACVQGLQGDWFAPVAGQHFDCIVSNPPYIAAGDEHLAQGDLRFEPATALAAGDDGLDDLRHIIAQAPAHLLPGGWLLLEHGYDQAAAVRALLAQTGFVAPQSWLDLAGIERVSGGCLAD